MNTIRRFLVLTCFAVLSDVAYSCNYNLYPLTTNLSRFIEGGKIFLCAEKNRQNQTTLTINHIDKQKRNVVVIPESKEDQLIRIVETNKDNTFALIESKKSSPPTKDDPIGAMITRYFLLDINSATLSNFTPNIGKDCQVGGARLAGKSASAMTYTVSGSIKKYSPESGRWTLSGCAQDHGVYVTEFADKSIRRLSNQDQSSIVAISPSGEVIGHLGSPSGELKYRPTILTSVKSGSRDVNLTNLLSSRVPDRNIETAMIWEFLDENSVLGTYLETKNKEAKRSVLFKMSLTGDDFIELDSIDVQQGGSFIFVRKVSKDKSKILYGFNSHNGYAELRYIENEQHKPILISKAESIYNEVLFSDSGVILKEDGQLKHVDSKTGASFEYNILAQSFSNARKKLSKVNASQIDLVKNMRINMQSLRIVGDRLLYLTYELPGECNQHLFSVPILGGEAKLLSNLVKPGTCGARHLDVKENEVNIIYTNYNDSLRTVKFYETTINGSKSPSLVYSSK